LRIKEQETHLTLQEHDDDDDDDDDDDEVITLSTEIVYLDKVLCFNNTLESHIVNNAFSLT